MWCGHTRTESVWVQALMRVATETHAGAGKLKAYVWKIFQELMRREENGTLYDVNFPQPETPGASSSMPPPQGLAEMWNLTATESDEESEQQETQQQHPSTQPDPAKEVHEEHVGRVYEESMCRAILINLKLERLPYSETVRTDSEKLLMLVHNYNRDFLEEHTRMVHLDGFPKTTRLWVQECTWCFDEMARRNWLPYNLRSVHTWQVRDAASQAAEAFGDPGNLALDVAVHVLRLWRYVEEVRSNKVLRVAPGEYGTDSNKSGKGPVNLRGNIIEALIHDLQKMASFPEHQPKGKWPKGKGGCHGKGKGR